MRKSIRKATAERSACEGRYKNQSRITPTFVRLIFALQNHQPVGNFDGVSKAGYRQSYWPFLGVMEDYPDIPFVLHTSGPLMEWLAERKPDYINRVRQLVESGRVEILGGPFFEPILTMSNRSRASIVVSGLVMFRHDDAATTP